MTANINYDRVHGIQTSMKANGMDITEAVTMSLALEFAAAHPEFASLFGQFCQDNLNGILNNISKTN